MTSESTQRRGVRHAVFDFPIEVLAMPRLGKAYDLASGWWPGMPIAPDHPAFQLLTYRSPAGQRNQRDLPLLQDNRVNFGFVSELMLCTSHSGTHIDALGHVTCGAASAWHGGHSSDAHLGDFGLLNSDAAELPPMLSRGVMLDIPAALDLDHLAQSQPVGPEELERAAAYAAVEIRPGDVVLIRTGAMRNWPDGGALQSAHGSGLTLEGATWLSARSVAAVGADNSGLEISPTTIPGDPLPVHRFLIQENGIPILEWVRLEDLARDGIHQFLFICLPLTIKGATGSMVRPLAVI